MKTRVFYSLTVLYKRFSPQDIPLHVMDTPQSQKETFKVCFGNKIKAQGYTSYTPTGSIYSCLFFNFIGCCKMWSHHSYSLFRNRTTKAEHPHWYDCCNQTYYPILHISQTLYEYSREGKN